MYYTIESPGQNWPSSKVKFAPFQKYFSPEKKKFRVTPSETSLGNISQDKENGSNLNHSKFYEEKNYSTIISKPLTYFLKTHFDFNEKNIKVFIDKVESEHSTQNKTQKNEEKLKEEENNYAKGFASKDDNEVQEMREEKLKKETRKKIQKLPIKNLQNFIDQLEKLKLINTPNKSIIESLMQLYEESQVLNDIIAITQKDCQGLESRDPWKNELQYKLLYITFNTIFTQENGTNK